MRVSIVIPCKNAGPFVAEAIESCFRQNVEVQVIVVDDGSEDESRAIAGNIAKRRPEVVLLKSIGSGACAARNTGLKAVSGEYTVFLDADDILPDDCLRPRLKVAERLSDSIVFGMCHRFTTTPSKREVHYHRWLSRVPSETRVPHKWLLAQTPPISCSLYRTDKLLEIGGFNEKLTNRQDIDLFVRYLVGGCTPIFVACDALYYRNHSNPGRVSKQKKEIVHRSQLELLHSWLEICERAPLGSALREEIPTRAWKWGREMLRVGLRDEADQYFDMSRSVSGRSSPRGPWWYVAIATILGPYRAEVLIESAKGALRGSPVVGWLAG